MRRVIVVVCLAAILTSVVGAALASQTDWTISIRAGWYNGSTLGSGSAVTAGAEPDPPDLRIPMQPPDPNLVNLALSGAGWQWESYVTYDSDDPLPYSYELTNVTGANYAHDMYYLTFWSSSDRAIPADYTVTIKEGYSTLVTWTGADLYVASDPASGMGPVGFWSPVFGRPGFWDESYDILTIEISVPEPSGLCALAAGALSVVGFALRRRKA